MGKRTVLKRRSEDTCLQIEATRRRIEEEADALREKASAKELLRPLTSRLTQAKGSLSETFGEGGGKILDSFRESPVPLTLVGVGLGWLILRDIRGRRPETGAPSELGTGEKTKDADSTTAHGVKDAAEKVGDAAKKAAGKVSDKMGSAANKVKEVAKEGARKTSDWFTTTLEENPMILAAGALALGIVAGLSIPVTKKEVETAGKLGEKMAEAALEKGAETMEKLPEPSGEEAKVSVPPESGGSSDSGEERSRTEPDPAQGNLEA